jgi:pilus assembly protein Flp/PilA
MKNLFNRFVREDQGQDLIEYALLAGFIALTSVAAITAVGTNLNLLWQKVSSQVSSAANAS